MVSYYNIIKFFIIYNIETKYDDVKDSFMKLKFQLSEKISKFEHLLLQKDTFNENPSGKELVEKYKIDKKLVDQIEDVQIGDSQKNAVQDRNGQNEENQENQENKKKMNKIIPKEPNHKQILKQLKKILKKLKQSKKL